MHHYHVGEPVLAQDGLWDWPGFINCELIGFYPDPEYAARCLVGIIQYRQMKGERKDDTYTG